MANKYNSVVETVTAIQFNFDVLKDLYMFLGMTDVTYSVKNRNLSGVITGSNNEKLSVQKNDFVVKDSQGIISVWKPDDFNKKYKIVEAK